MKCALIGVRLSLCAGWLVSAWCGAAGAQEMVKVPGGSFRMGSARDEPDERPVHTVRLAPFELDRDEVTRGQYGRCVSAGPCRPARRYPGATGPQLPAVGVTWRDARTYCRWRGKRLPSEAEWERAARGTDERRYPWGDRLDCGKANFGNYLGAGPCEGQNPGKLLPPGSRPGGVSPAGANDMAGNVWEWVEDAHGPYPAEGRRVPRRAGEIKRVVRGGSCCSYFALPRTTNRLAFPPDYRDNDLGFRCARDAAAGAAPGGGGAR